MPELKKKRKREVVGSKRSRRGKLKITGREEDEKENEEQTDGGNLRPTWKKLNKLL